MTSQPSDIKDQRSGQDFDTTAELWDRIVDDITSQGHPCLETVEKLVDDACHQSPRLQPSQPDQD